MDEHLKRFLTPADDGRGFTEAVLFRASGALARRRLAVARGADLVAARVAGRVRG